MKILLALMTDSHNCYCAAVLNFKECNVPCRTKRNYKFTQKRIGIRSFATCERHKLHKFVGFFNCGASTNSRVDVICGKKTKQPL